MVGQNLLLELIEGDKVQLYVYTGAGISDHKNSHYTQFIGCLLRPSVETLHAVMRRLGSSDALEDDVSTAARDIGWGKVTLSDLRDAAARYDPKSASPFVSDTMFRESDAISETS